MVFGMKLVLLIIVVRLVMTIPEFSHLSIEQRHIVKCVTNIVGRHFSDGESILVSLPRLDYIHPQKERSLYPKETLSSIMIVAESIIIALTDMSWPLFVIKPPEEMDTDELKKKVHDQNAFHRYIIGFMQFDDRSLINSVLLLNPRPETLHITIQTFEEYDNGRTKASILFTVLSILKIYNSIFIIPSSVKNNSLSNANNTKIKTLNVYSWHPFERPDDCGNFKRESLINEWIIDGNGGFIEDKDIFLTKLPSKFKGCPIQIITDSLYLSTSYTTSPVLRYTEKEVFNFVLSFLNVKESVTEFSSLFDLYRTSVPLNGLEEVMMLCTPTFPYFTSRIKWHVPCPKRSTEIGNFAKVFSWSLWAVIFLTTFFMSFCIWGIYKIGRNTVESRNYRTISSCFLNVWAVLVGTSVVEWPLSLRVRTVLIFWVYFSFMISMVFQSFFTSFLVQPGYSKQMSTVAELNKSGIKKIAPGYEAFIWSHNSSELKTMTGNRYGNSDECITEFLNNKDSAILISVADINMMSSYLGGRFHFCSIEDRSMTVFYGVQFSKRSIFMEPFTIAISRLFETGIMGKFEKDFHMMLKNDPHNSGSIKPLIETLEKVRKNGTHLMENVIGDEFFIFSISHMRVAFYLLLVGYTISFLVFVIEKIY